MKTTATTFLILVLVGYILYLTQCRGTHISPCKPDTIIHVDTFNTVARTDTIYRPGDTIYRSKIVKTKGGTVIETRVPVEVVKEIPTVVDTQAIISLYYSKELYSDSVSNDDMIAKVIDTLYKNKVTGRTWIIKNLRQIQKPKAQFYFGGGGYTSLFLNKGLSTETISGGHIDFGYINRKGEHLKVDLMRSGGRWHEGLSFYHTFK